MRQSIEAVWNQLDLRYSPVGKKEFLTDINGVHTHLSLVTVVSVTVCK